MSRGFITIATGDKKYHDMAKTLVKSYKLTSVEPMPFAVITDDTHDKFEEFDEVVVIKNATRSYMDKIDIMRYSPYDETIFIDSDSIAFNDLNIYWKDFGEYDFSAYGRVFYEDSEQAWFKISEALKYGGMLEYSIDLHGGIYYFKKGKMVDNIYKICKDISNDYGSFRFKNFKKLADEPIIALAMAVNEAKPIEQINNRFCFLRNAKKLQADFFGRKLSYWFNNSYTTDGKLIHFGTSRTILPLYQVERRKVDFEWKYKKNWNAWAWCSSTVAAYIESLGLCIRSSKKLIFKRFKI